MWTFRSLCGRAALLGLFAFGFAAIADGTSNRARAISLCPTSEARIQFEDGSAAYADDGLVDAIVARSRACDVPTRFVLTTDATNLSAQRAALIQGELVRRGVEAGTIRTEVCPGALQQSIVLMTLIFRYSTGETPVLTSCDRLAE